MAELGPAQLAAFMTEVTGHAPFPWQQRLLEVVLDTGWPALLDLPTGTGKTSTLLVALYALALAPERSHRRIALVVDRRIIVDQVDAFARRLAHALASPERPVCREVAHRLRALCPSGSSAEPVRVVHLRGGIPRDDRWVGTPDQPTIIASTVDQVGSRLLFRGYGVSESMRPVHAGVLARDTLYLLDEVHLATAFEETLDRLERTYAGWAERSGIGRALRVVRMSATPRATASPLASFGLDAEDRAHPVLARRLQVARLATLATVKTKRTKHADDEAINRARVAEAACERATQALQAGAKAVGIVVNRVDTARRAAARLRERSDLEVLLITGRMRPFDKTEIQAALERAAGAGVVRDPEARPTVVVATSCIEAGADLDFDALVTEAASLDALRQRFGRLDRLGRLGNAPAWILGRSDQLSASAAPDPVYGEALRDTWDYLQQVAHEDRVDFGLEAFPVPDPARLATLLPAVKEAPVLFPSYLDMWSETRPAPHPDPDPTLWLHGKGAEPDRDVSVVFRADIPAATSEDADLVERAAEALELLPPLADEAVSVARHELTRWLEPQGGSAWRWTSEGLEVVAIEQLRAGDTIIAPAGAGGLGAGTWDPNSGEPVEDVAERAAFAPGEVAKLRLDPRTLPAWLGQDLPSPPESDEAEVLDEARAACSGWLDALAQRSETATDGWAPLLRALGDASRKRTLTLTTSAFGDRVWRVTAHAPKRSVEATTEDAVSVFSGREVSLAMHLQDVEAWADAFARAAGLDRDVAEDVALAALLHDIGKADPRFQALLRGGDPIAAGAGEPLAKSRQFGSLAQRQRAERRSGWPRGLRHELVSLALLDASPELRAKAHDLELVRHLVASHHGWCRPWAPSTIDPDPQHVRVEVAGIRAEVSTQALDDALLVECASRFRRMCRRYGWHGLAYLEALLRLGDHRASATPGARPGELA